MVVKLEEFLQSLYSYFSSSFKCHLKFTEFAEIVETWRLKILRNVKTCYISMLEPWKCVLEEYKTLIVKMT